MILARSSRLRACGSLGWVCRKFQLGEHLKERLPPSGVIRPHARAPQLASQMDWLPATGFRFRDVSADYDADARTREAGRQAERLVPKTLAAINYRGQIWHGNPLRYVGAAGETLYSSPAPGTFQLRVHLLVAGAAVTRWLARLPL